MDRKKLKDHILAKFLFKNTSLFTKCFFLGNRQNFLFPPQDFIFLLEIINHVHFHQ